MIERLQKYMANCGVASRRKCEEIIKDGRVMVNSVIINELGFKINTEADCVNVDSVDIKPEENKVYIILNKPVGIVSTVNDEKGRQTIIDLIKINKRIYPIGRLDYDSSGLILLTNDGDIYNKVIHPSNMINKVYEALVKGIPDELEISKFETGIDIEGYKTAKAKFIVLREWDFSTEVKIIIHEGKNRQIRKMCDAIGHEVISLKRISVGELNLRGIKSGEWRYLTEDEIRYLKSL